MLVFVALLLTAARASGSVTVEPGASTRDALGIFADPDAIPEMQEAAFVGTVFVPNDAAVAEFLHAAQLTPRQLRDNTTLMKLLAREHVVPHVALRRLDFDPDEALTTLSQETLYVRPTAGVYIVAAAHSSAVVTFPDIAAGRSVLHVIDSVLIPRTVEVEL